jgi:hypothetical protein
MSLRGLSRFLLSALGLMSLLAVYSIQPPLSPAVSAHALQSIFASPVQAGCYLARHDRCRIHVEPFTLNLGVGSRLDRFQLLATRSRDGRQTVIYDFRTDMGNPAPLSGNTYTPTSVAKDFAVSCGESYSLSLLGQSNTDSSLLSLGTTGSFTCPVGTYFQFFPAVRK